MLENVSRETLEKLAAFEALVQKWSPTINLVSRTDLSHLNTRHIQDSAQLYDLAPKSSHTWLDLGSGGGFPGIVCAAIAQQTQRHLSVTLVESDSRKCAFLREAARILELQITVIASRIESLPATPSDVITARALAPLPKLLEWANTHTHPGTTLLFPKGRQAETELTQAYERWKMTLKRIPSRTDPAATILRITDLCPKP